MATAHWEPRRKGGVRTKYYDYPKLPKHPEPEPEEETEDDA